MKKKCLIIGVGKMGTAHLKVLKGLNLCDFGAWSPSNSRKNIIESFGGQFLEGNLLEVVKNFKPSHIILACPIDSLVDLAKQLINLNIKNLLIEKPLSLNFQDKNFFIEAQKKKNLKVYIGYNRRFYSSINYALNQIKKNNEKIESVIFEFNEILRSSNGPIGKSKKVKNKWIISNSLHLIDSAFHPVGLPIKSLSTFNTSNKNLKWHPSGSIFYGCGLTEKKIPFVFHANWNAPGRWKFEWTTKSFRYIFSPLEELCVMSRDSFKIKNINLKNKLDCDYKPGVFLQNKNFLLNKIDKRFVDIDYAFSLIDLGNKIGNY